VESPSLEIFQPCLAAVLCSLLWVTLLGQGAGLGDPRGPCQPLLHPGIDKGGFVPSHPQKVRYKSRCSSRVFGERSGEGVALLSFRSKRCRVLSPMDDY